MVVLHYICWYNELYRKENGCPQQILYSHIIHVENLYLIKNILIRKGANFRIDFKGGIAKKSVYAS